MDFAANQMAVLKLLAWGTGRSASISGCIVHEEISPGEKTAKRVLLIFNYHPERPGVIEETSGAEGILKNKGVGEESVKRSDEIRR